MSKKCSDAIHRTKNQRKNLLLEIGCEELPVSHQRHVIANYAAGPELKGIKNYGATRIYATPRRIVWYIENIAEKQEDKHQKVFGPPKNVAFDKEGKPTQEALGFAESQGAKVEDLKIEKNENKGGGEYICIEKTIKGKNTLSYLKEALPRFLQGVWFEKTMRWDGEGIRFSRPVRWVLALYEDKIVKFKAFGLESSNVTYGNRLVSKKKIIIKEADIEEYKKTLKKEYVVVDQEERKRTIKDERSIRLFCGMEKLEAELNADVTTQGIITELVEEVSGLVEFPKVIHGEFPPEYLALNTELLATCMSAHERFFPVFDKDIINLEAKFISFSNNPFEKAENVIKKGNESMLVARLADAKFFYEQDTKEGLDAKVGRLKQIIFQGGVGSLYDKTQRLKEISLFIIERLNKKEIEEKIKRAAELSKIDIGSHVVNEFPSLQGTMGKIYALNFGEDKEVAQAIDDHYKPRFKIDTPGFIGAIVGIADRIDNICVFFAQGYKATGSEDPYGARRDAQSLLEVLMHVNDVSNISIKELIEKELELIEEKIVNKNAKDEILNFIRQRIQTFFKTADIEYDELDAVMEIAFNKNLRTAVERANVIKKFRSRPDFKKFIIAFKRVVNILKQADIDLKDVAVPLCFPPASAFAESAGGVGAQKVDKEFLKEEEEKKIYEIYLNIKDEVENKIKNNNFKEAMGVLLTNLAKPIDDFFDHVLVMTDYENLRRNRLSLLYLIANLFFLVADFSKIVVSEAPVEKK